jgi:hypothetical protein
MAIIFIILRKKRLSGSTALIYRQFCHTPATLQHFCNKISSILQICTYISLSSWPNLHSSSPVDQPEPVPEVEGLPFFPEFLRVWLGPSTPPSPAWHEG